MASSTIPDPHAATPSCAQAAFAIAIIRSKPQDTTIREYVFRLRDHVRQGQPPSSFPEQSHYLDLVSYWQGQYQRVQDECERLRSINIKLERSNHQLSHQAASSLSERPGTVPISSKRKAPASPTRASKRSKPGSHKTTEKSAEHTQEGINDDYDFLEGLGDDGTNLLDALYTAHGLCRSTACDPDALCRSLVRVASSLGTLIRHVAHRSEQLSRQSRRTQNEHSLGDDKSDFALALTVSARAFMSVLVGLTQMAIIGCDRRSQDLVVYELTGMFKATLLAIESSALHTAHVAKSVPPPTNTKRDKAKVIPPVKDSASARALAHFLISILSFLEKGNELHRRLFEGFVFLLLERIAKRLYFVTFGRHQSSTIQGGLTIPHEPGNDTQKTLSDQEALGVRLEAKALILILQRAIGLAPHHMNTSSNKAPTTNHGRTLSLRTLPSNSKARLSSIAQDRLQRTLVTCMYGSKGDDEFLDILTKPMPSTRLGTLPNVARIEDQDVDSWYKEEVWRLVGWDILARERNL